MPQEQAQIRKQFSFWKGNAMTKSSSLLVNEPPLLVLPGLAKLLGLNEAIILQQVHYWLQNPKCPGIEYQGKKWIFNTYDDWQRDNFPFWSTQTIRRGFTELEERGIIIAAQLEATSWNRRKSYTIDYETLERLRGEHIEDIKMSTSKVSEWANRSGQNGQILSTETTHRLPENTPGLQKSAGVLVSVQENCEELQEGQEVCTELEETIMQENDPKVEQAKKRIETALVGASPFMDASGLNVLNLDAYPEEIRPVVARVCQLWRLKPPTRGKKGGEFARWIEDSRALKDACGEFGTQALEAARADFKAYMETHQGLPPFTVSGPGSLVKTCRAKAGELRQRQDNGTETVTRKGGGFYA